MRSLWSIRGRAAVQGPVGRQARVSAALYRALQAGILGAVVFLFVGAGGSTQARFNDLGNNRLMCTCGCGQVLLKCNHIQCPSLSRMSTQLQNALERGDSDDLILQGFVQEYGPTVIAAPTGTGFNVVAWIMPFALLLVGFVLVSYIVRAWKNKPAPALGDGIAIPSGEELDELRKQARKETEL